MSTDLIQALGSEISVESLVSLCQGFFKSVSTKKIDSHVLISQLPQITDPQKGTVVTLLKLELLIFHTSPVNHNEIQHYLKSLEYLNFSDQESRDALLLKGKYQDLLTDYNICFSDSSKRPRLVDLINKKLNILKLVSSSEQLTGDLQFKILLFYLLSEADLRKRNIYHYLKEEGFFTKNCGEIIERYVNFTTGKSLIPLYIYHDFVEHLTTHYSLFKCLFARYRVPILEYHYENNIQRLPRCFKSITFSRISSLISDQGLKVDFEDLVFGMIVGRQLPDGTHIDQMKQLVIFGAKVEKHDPMNSRIKRIGEMVDSLAT